MNIISIILGLLTLSSLALYVTGHYLGLGARGNGANDSIPPRAAVGSGVWGIYGGESRFLALKCVSNNW